MSVALRLRCNTVRAMSSHVRGPLHRIAGGAATVARRRLSLSTVQWIAMNTH